MAVTRGTITVVGTSAVRSTGRAIGLDPYMGRSGKYTAQVVFLANSTTAKVTMQGSLDGNVWQTIGTAGTLIKSSSPFYSTHTSAAYSLIRAIMTSRTTKAGGNPKVAVFMNGA